MIGGNYRVLRVLVRELGNGVYRVKGTAWLDGAPSGVPVPDYAADFISDLVECAQRFGVEASSWSSAWAESDGEVVAFHIIALPK